MIELIASIILVVSLLGISVIVIRKIPLLREMEIGETSPDFSFPAIKQRIQQGLTAKAEKFFQLDFWDVLLQKVVSKVRVFSLKLETKCSYLLEKTRERSKREKESKKYWEKMTRIVKKKKGK